MHHTHHHQHRHLAERSLHPGHMEHPSKRRRVERRGTEESVGDSPTWEDKQEGIEISISEHIGVSGGVPKLVIPPAGDNAFDLAGSLYQQVGPPLEPLDISSLPAQALELRQVLAPVNTAAGQASGVVRRGTAPAPSVINGVTKAVNDVASKPSSTTPGSVQPPAGVAAQDARNSALAAEQSQAKIDNRLPPPPAEKDAVNPAGTVSAAAVHSPMSIPVQGSDSSSQQVLSAPLTPLPASPQASANPTASSSYFSQPSPSSAGAAASSDISAIHSTDVPALAKSASSNSTMSGSVTSSATITLNSASSSTDAALLAVISASRASRSSLEAMSSSATGSDLLGASGSSTGSLTSPSTMMTMTSSLGKDQSSSGNGPASTGAGAGGIGGASNTSGAPTSTSSAGTGSGGGSNPPSTPALVGGIVGGISGLVLILLAALLLLRWRKGRFGSGERRTISPPMLQSSAAGGGPQKGTGTGTTGTMTQRSSIAPIAAAGFFGRLRPSSSQTATTADTAPSERGFQKISGRKLPSVLTSGGDGYGEAAAAAGAAGAAASTGAGAVAASKDAPSIPQQKGVVPGRGPSAGLAPALRPSPPHSLSGSSFYRDSRGFYGGMVPESTSGLGATEPSGSPTSSSPTFPSPLAIAGGAKDPEIPGRRPTMRPGPARTPVINEAGTIRPPRPVQATPPPVGQQAPRDLVGRSHPSEDGSRASRFRESTTPP